MTIPKSLISRLSLVLPLLASGFAVNIASAQTFTTLHSFTGADGESPQAGVVQAANGEFYGTTPAGGANCTSTPDLCGTAFKIAPSGALTTLYNFCSKVECLDGKGPLEGLVEAPNGDLYGTTYGGGAQPTATLSSNVSFEVAP
jgi:hypothetical protein